MEFSSVNGLRNCLRRGVGVTICPEATLGEGQTGNGIARLALSGEDPAGETSVLMIWHVGKWCSPILKAFMDAARAVMGGVDG